MIRAFVGGAHDEKLAQLPDDETIEMVRGELKDIMGISAKPVLSRIFRWPQGMPQYTLGHLDRVETIERRAAEHPGLFVAGGAYRGVGVPDCINSGQKAAEAALALTCSAAS